MERYTRENSRKGLLTGKASGYTPMVRCTEASFKMGLLTGKENSPTLMARFTPVSGLTMSHMEKALSSQKTEPNMRETSRTGTEMGREGFYKKMEQCIKAISRTIK